MSRSLRRGALAATAVVFSIASLAACGAGNDAQTLQITPDNAAVTKGDIKVQNVLVITQASKDKKGRPAAVSATVFNSGFKEQTLDAITLEGGGARKVVLKSATGSGKVIVPAGGSVLLGGKGNASAVIEGGDAVQDGDVQKVVFKLSNTGDVALDAFVVPASGMYSNYGPTEAPAAGSTPSGSASGSPAATPSGSPSGSPAGTPSGSPSGAASGTPSGSPSHSAGH
ncbi:MULTISPECIES: DUF461 domain-containing protein [unclassified Streptomyces]|uniref:DUF461 domain-containing protein n=1 Tax=unclassified Streptomyces TaxID=2593676 RepID=UPI001BE8FA6B|nr:MULTISPECIES: DUF461 domain-containing protein [unclassified Streptomyces]MBT2408366.1 DUF461 domain-containing protein [Streptomyces sp. ISL-21]MBT2457947.1 DUF461 domain-containing protein [Streptomyces sp. ISL-86]MBT2611695.1 DUF461 domain-containing protein [Streptomyces sp. ISL-87]